MDRKSLFDLPKELLIEIILNVNKQNKKQNYKEKEELPVNPAVAPCAWLKSKRA